MTEIETPQRRASRMTELTSIVEASALTSPSRCTPAVSAASVSLDRTISPYVCIGSPCVYSNIHSTADTLPPFGVGADAPQRGLQSAIVDGGITIYMVEPNPAQSSAIRAISSIRAKGEQGQAGACLRRPGKPSRRRVPRIAGQPEAIRRNARRDAPIDSVALPTWRAIGGRRHVREHVSSTWYRSGRDFRSGRPLLRDLASGNAS